MTEHSVGTARLRVAYCIDNMNVGGTEMNAVRTAAHLVSRGVDLSVFSLASEGPLLDRYGELGVPVHFLPIRGMAGRSALRYGRELADTVRREGIQVVHAHDVYSNMFAAPWSRLGGAAFIASRRWWKGSPRRSRRWANRLSYVFANRVLANSASVGDLLVRQERLNRAGVVVVPNFLDEEAFAPPPAGWQAALLRGLGIPAGSPIAGIVASLSPVKDHATLLEATAILGTRQPNFHIILVGGDGGSRSALVAQAERLGIAERVHFAGLMPNVPSAHHAFDVSVLTSVSEGLPNSILEAMAAGRPVVATAVGAVGDAVLDGVTGYLIPARDPSTLADRLNELLENEALRAEMGRAGQLRAREEFSAETAIDRLLDTYMAISPARARGSVNV